MTIGLPPLPELVSTAQYELKWWDARLSYAMHAYARQAQRMALEEAALLVHRAYLTGTWREDLPNAIRELESKP